MLSLAEIQSYYPEHLHPRSEFLLREYLQYKILEILFESEYAPKLMFLGGTCLRIIHQNNRFSEDLDFDNFNLTEKNFEAISIHIRTALEREGYQTEIRQVIRGAFHCYIRFSGLLYEMGLSGHREAIIRINLDTEPQGFVFQPDIHFLNRFDVFTSIPCTPPDLLLSQKLLAMSQRRRPQGRDFYDAVFLFGKTSPNFEYLEQKLNISNLESLKSYLFAICARSDFSELAKDVQPSLFNPRDIKKVEQFPAFVKNIFP